MSKFGFEVTRRQTHDPETWMPTGFVEPAEWHVSLPHQCDSWDIAGEDFDGYVTADEVITELKAFIKEAQDALWALQNGRETQ